jgi:hypothetical protein
MIKTGWTKWTRDQARSPLKADVDDPDRRTLLYLLSFLLAGFDRIRLTRVPPAVPSPAWLDRWEDEDYVYFETRIAGDSSELELDLTIHDGVIFARVARGDADAEAEALPDDTSPDAVCA